MTLEEGLLLLEKKFGSVPDVDTATDLIQALDRVPLAISQAVAYIQAKEPRSSVEKYLVEFRESERKKTRLLEHAAAELRRDGGASNTILTTWQISFDYIRHKRASAADLLSLMSFFDRQGIPEWVLKSAEKPNGRASERGEADDATSSSDSGTENDTNNDVDLDFEEDIGMLRDYCLIRTNEEGDEFEMHGLVQLSTRKWLGTHKQQEKFKQQYIQRMAASFPMVNSGNWATCRKLIAHVEVAINYSPTDGTLEKWATLLYSGGVFTALQGRFDIAERMVSKARKACVKKVGVEGHATLVGTSTLATVLGFQGRWDASEELDVQVTEIYKTKLGADHPITLISMASLASTYRDQGRLDAAEGLLLQVLETCKTNFGADHPIMLAVMATLASTYSSQGRCDASEEVKVQIVEICKAKLGVDHPDTLTHMSSLALTYRKQGRLDAAEELQVQVMEIRKTKLGADHPNTLASMADLSFTWKALGKDTEAIYLMQECVRLRRSKVG